MYNKFSEIFHIDLLVIQMASMLIEKVITDARRLSDRLKEHDITTNNLISRTFTLQRRLEAMKQVSYLDNMNINQFSINVFDI